MKQGIHPEYKLTQVTCSCGNTFTTRSIKVELHVELCNMCHPFYTGKQKLVDTGGRVERFQKKYAANQKRKTRAPEAGPAKQDAAGSEERPEAAAPAEQSAPEASAPEATETQA